MALHLQTVAAGQGVVWVRRAFQIVLYKPFAFAAMFITFLVGALVLLTLPFVGSVVVMMALPLLSLGFMIATRSAAHGGPVHPGQFVEPLRGDPQRRRALLQMCVAYALTTLAIVALSDAVDGGRFERLQVLMATSQADDQAAHAELQALLNDDLLFWGLIVRFGLASLLSVPFWHAPALVWWGGQGAWQSLFSSTLAIWRTRGAMLAYALAWVFVIGAFSLLVGGLFALIGARQWVGVLAVPAGLMFSCAFYASLYFTFSDTFRSTDMVDTPLP